MTTSEYRDMVDGLRDAVVSFKACATDAERDSCCKRIQRNWRELSLLDQPKRLPVADAERCRRILKQAADLLNQWQIEIDSRETQAVA